LCKDLRALELACPPTQIPDLFPLRGRYDQQFFGLGLGFSETAVCFASRAIASRRWDNAVCSAGIVWLVGFPTLFFNNVGWFSVCFISNRLFVIGSGDCVHKKRLGSPHGGGGGRVATCFVGLFFGLYSVSLHCLRSSPLSPLFPFALIEHRASGARGRGWQGMVARFLGASLNWAGPRSGSWGSIV